MSYYYVTYINGWVWVGMGIQVGKGEYGYESWELWVWV